MSDPVRRRMAAGEVSFNAWVTFPGVAAATILASAGFDAVTVDLQHGEHTEAGLGEAVEAIERAGAVPFVRIAWNHPVSVMRALDLGARGVICPMVNTAEEAEAFVRSCRYPPRGTRSYGPVRSAFGAGREQTEASNEAVHAYAQIETAEGLANVEDICSTEGLDGVYVGPADLSLTLGYEAFADLASEGMRDALTRIVDACSAGGVVAGIHAPASIDHAVDMVGMGFRFIGAAGDRELLAGSAARTLERARADWRRGN